MGKRYSVDLLGQFDGTPNLIVSWDYDLKTLIPLSLKGKTFLLHSSLHTDNLGTDLHSGITVGINLPMTYNRQFPQDDDYIWLGIADPIFVNTTQTEMKYMYPETACYVKMVEYPDVFPLKARLFSNQQVNLQDDVPFVLHLTFEEM